MKGQARPHNGRIDLSAIDPKGTGKLTDEESVQEAMKKDLEDLYDLHYLMFAENKRALLIILQGIDASGKDGLVRHMASGMNPQGVKIHSFKKPSDEELDHDYLWRVHRAMPGRGEVAIFNRSHYEEVTVVKVHPEFLIHQRLPDELTHAKRIFRQRYRQINQFERIMVDNGTVIVKLFLHISPEEQEQRFAERLQNPKKNWKFSKGDLLERQFWNEYRKAFESMIQETSTDHAPWYVIPADRKWYRNYLATNIVVRTLKSLKMTFPSLRDE